MYVPSQVYGHPACSYKPRHVVPSAKKEERKSPSSGDETSPGPSRSILRREAPPVPGIPGNTVLALLITSRLEKRRKFPKSIKVVDIETPKSPGPPSSLTIPTPIPSSSEPDAPPAEVSSTPTPGGLVDGLPVPSTPPEQLVVPTSAPAEVVSTSDPDAAPPGVSTMPIPENLEDGLPAPSASPQIERRRLGQQPVTLTAAELAAAQSWWQGRSDWQKGIIVAYVIGVVVLGLLLMPKVVGEERWKKWWEPVFKPTGYGLEAIGAGTGVGIPTIVFLWAILKGNKKENG